MMEFLVPSTLWKRCEGKSDKVWTVVRRDARVWVETCGEVLGGWPDEMEAARATRSYIELWAAEQSTEHVAVHAAVLAYNDAAIVLPGRSGIGKSTLALALIRAGAIYYSDEFAVFNRRAEVLPYPRPLAVRRIKGESQVETKHLSPSQLGAAVGQRPLCVKVIADLPFELGLDAVDAQELPSAIGALCLIENAIAARSRPQAVLDVAVRVASEAKTLKGKRGPSEQAAQFLHRYLTQ
jgi:hypothetical protein